MKDCNNCLNKERKFTVCIECKKFYADNKEELKDLWRKRPDRKGDDFIWESE